MMVFRTTSMWKCVLGLGVSWLVAGSAFSSSLPADGLQVQFRSDHAGRVKADTPFPAHGSPINSWEPEAGVESPFTLVKIGARPNWQENAFQRADGTSLPAVRFIRNTTNTGNIKNTATGTDHTQMHLVSSVDTTLNLGKATTWFLVMNNLTANNQKGLFGFDNSPRFGAFFIGSGDNNLRFHNDCNPGGNGNVSVPIGQSNLLDSRGDGTRLVCGLNGDEVRNTSSFTSGFEVRSSAGKFYLGRMVDVENSAAADIAELAVYNRALKDAEVRIVRNALAVRWGLTITDPIWTGAAAGFCDDLAGIGSSTTTGNGRITGAVETSGNAGGLILSVPDGSLSGADGYLLVAHDSKPAKIAWSEADGCLRVQRTWRTETTLDSVPAVTFTFDLSELVSGISGFEGRLLYRADSSVAFADTGLTGVLNGLQMEGGEGSGSSLTAGTFSFTFAAGAYKDGEYALLVTSVTEAEKVAPTTDGITVWFKPDESIQTNETGAVTNWVNQGSIGAAADVHAYSGTVTVVQNALSNAAETENYPALDFGGNSFLRSSAATDLGRDSQEPPSWFIVFKPGPDAEAQKDCGLFGLVNNDYRFGSFFPLANGGYRPRGYVGTGGSDYPTVISATSWHLMDIAGYWQSKQRILPRLVVDAKEEFNLINSGYLYQNVSSLFKVGHFREDAWGKPFPGQIAEIRIYKQTLDPLERLLVDQELADTYGLTLNQPFLSATHASGASYRSGLSVIGYGTANFEAPAATSPGCGGLVVDYPEWDGTSDVAIWLAHNGGSLAWTTTDGTTALERAWYLSGSGISTFPTLRFNFLLGDAEDGSEYVLLYREQDNTAWSAMPYLVTVAYGTASVRIPLGLPAKGYFTLGKAASGETIARPCAAIENALVGWYRADTGVVASGGTVSTWRNLGIFGTKADVTTAAGAPQLAPTAFPRASGVSEAGVFFDGSSYLQTAGNLKWCAGNNNTWFAVFKVTAGIVPSDMGIFGNREESRFGSFFTSSAVLRTHGYVNNKASNYCVIPTANFTIGQPMLLDSSRAGNCVDSYLDGLHQDGKNPTQGNASSSQFMIGSMVGLTHYFKGDFAEVRIYNRTLSDAERNIVANHLAARYGITMRNNLLYGGAADDCVLDVVGIGRSTSNANTPNTSNEGTVTNSWSVHVARSVTISGDSAGLTLEAVGSLANGDYVLAGHGVKENEWVRVPTGTRAKRMKRAWHITKTNAASLDLTLTFSLADAGVSLLEERLNPQYQLMRSVSGGAWEAVATALTRTANGFTTTLSATDFVEGQYTLGAEVTPSGTVLSIR
ncbi:MAG: hypothetical protein IKR48_07430 [Kiritimatiellae bacterium]|nr:hypothetical protein [Kiritimatiellia bacterium]